MLPKRLSPKGDSRDMRRMFARGKGIPRGKGRGIGTLQGVEVKSELPVNKEKKFR